VHGGGGDYAVLTPYSSLSIGQTIGFVGGNTITDAMWP
jgi:hypothetical protein